MAFLLLTSGAIRPIIRPSAPRPPTGARWRAGACLGRRISRRRKSGERGKGAGPRWLLQKGISKKRTDAFVLASLAKEKIKTDERIIKRASELEKLGFKTMDAAHISCAERAADIMFTVDDDVLRVARIKRNLISIEIENPLRWLINVFQD